MNTNDKVVKFKKSIERAAIRYGLNLTVYDGKIAFVDQKEKKIVALWTPEYKLSDNDAEEAHDESKVEDDL